MIHSENKYMKRLECDNPVITLVNVPPHERSRLDGPISKDVYAITKNPAVGLAAINGILLDIGFKNINTLDPRFNPEYGEFTESEWELLVKSDVIGITSMTRNREVSLRLIEWIKEQNPNTIVIVGGADPTFESEKWLKGERGADFVVRNEGEITIIELMKALRDGGSLENIKGISYKDRDKIRHNEERPLLTEKELSEVALPFFPKYIEDNSRTHAVEGSRGCPHKCDFCAVTSLYKRTYRRKSDERIIAEIRASKEGKRVFFVDDNFAPLIRLKDVNETIRKIIANGLNNRDYVVQLDTVSVNKDPELAKRLRTMGVLAGCLGIESFDPKVLRGMGKATTADLNRSAIKILQDNGIYVHAMTIVGSKNETHESIQKLIDQLIKLGPNSIQIFAEGPVPGSELAKRVKVFEIAEKDTNLMDGQHLVRLPPPEFTCSGLQQEIFDMYAKFYSPRHVLNIIKPLLGILVDPTKAARAVQLTAINVGVRVFANKMLKEEKNNQYAKGFMEHLKQIDRDIAEQERQKTLRGWEEFWGEPTEEIPQEGTIFNAKDHNVV